MTDGAEAGTVDAMVDGEPPEPPRYWILWVVTVAAFAWPLLLTLCSGCIKVLPPAAPIRVEVVKAPMPPVPYCSVLPAPIPPPELKLNYKIEDVIDRTMVHYRDYNLVISWAMYMVVWSQSVQQCLDRLSNKPVVPAAQVKP